MKKCKNNKGFTLVELLVVIAIIGILAVVAVPALFKNIEKGKVADLEADMSAIRSAVLSYYADNSEYPINDTNGVTEGGDAIVVLQPDMTSIIKDDGTTDATKKLIGELEGLSFAFGGNYKLTNASGQETSDNVVKSPATLYLKITTDANSTLSDNGLKKLAKDLSLSDAILNTIPANQNQISSTTVSGVQTIIVPLLNK